jgi:hypothetical protein
MMTYCVDWFEGDGPLRPGIPTGTLPQQLSAEFETEGAARSHAERLIQIGRRAVTLRGPNGLVMRQAELESASDS